MKDRVRQTGTLCVFEWTNTRRHLVKNFAERIDISARVELFSQQLLRRHVGERTGGGMKVTVGAVSIRDRLEEFRQPKITNFHATVLRYQDIAGLQIAMQDPLLVRC